MLSMWCLLGEGVTEIEGVVLTVSGGVGAVIAVVDDISDDF